MIPVILSGGSGSRLWPLSRGMYPKQLLPLAHAELSLLQQTVLRAPVIGAKEKPIIVCNNEHRFMVAEQLHQLDIDATIMLEPAGRNTAPAIALAAFQAMRNGQDPLLLVMPADHVIQDETAFKEAVGKACKIADAGKLVTFGIVPTQPETGYGYIKSGNVIAGGYEVAEFREKPNAETAQSYLNQGGYFWNGGIFLFKASVFLSELKMHTGDVFVAAAEAVKGAQIDLDFLRADEKAFCRAPSISVDYAVMENTKLAAVVPMEAGWSDIGSWSALWEIADKDESGNVFQGDVVAHDTKNSHIVVESGIVATLGIEGLVIVQTADAVLVADRAKAQELKHIVERLKSDQRSQKDHHRKVYRPWGWYDSIDVGKNFQVKRIQVNPQARLSVQLHHHRAEHWVVVKGIAEIRNADDTFTLKANESTYIPIGTIHSLHNPSDHEPLEIIEVQSGEYLGEDDIIRFEDDYGREQT